MFAIFITFYCCRVISLVFTMPGGSVFLIKMADSSKVFKKLEGENIDGMKGQGSIVLISKDI